MSESPKRGNKSSAAPSGGPSGRPSSSSGPDPVPARPLKPRPILLTSLSLVFTLWVAFLVALYFKTEYPRRSIAPRPDAKGNLVPAAPAPDAR